MFFNSSGTGGFPLEIQMSLYHYLTSVHIKKSLG